jgi:hypothetical protein
VVGKVLETFGGFVLAEIWFYFDLSKTKERNKLLANAF